MDYGCDLKQVRRLLKIVNILLFHLFNSVIVYHFNSGFHMVLSMDWVSHNGTPNLQTSFHMWKGKQIINDLIIMNKVFE